jgi:hypothetical protein
MDLKEMRWMVVEWIYLDRDRDKFWAVVDMIMVLRSQQNAGKFVISWNTRPIRFSRRTVLNIAIILIRQLTDLSL